MGVKMKSLENRMHIHDLSIDKLYELIEGLEERVERQREEIKRLRKAIIQLQDLIAHLHNMTYEDYENSMPLERLSEIRRKGIDLALCDDVIFTMQ
jgi:predicted  nucleic acid-binding Zn-ribbon protein